MRHFPNSDQVVELTGREQVGVVDEHGAVQAGGREGREVAPDPGGAGVDGAARQPRLAVAGRCLQEDDGGCRRPADPPKDAPSIDTHGGSTVLNVGPGALRGPVWTG